MNQSFDVQEPQGSDTVAQGVASYTPPWLLPFKRYNAAVRQSNSGAVSGSASAKAIGTVSEQPAPLL